VVIAPFQQLNVNLSFYVQLLLLKRGGQVIYSGKLGRNSQKMVEYFEVHEAPSRTYILCSSISLKQE